MQRDVALFHAVTGGMEICLFISGTTNSITNVGRCYFFLEKTEQALMVLFLLCRDSGSTGFRTLNLTCCPLGCACIKGSFICQSFIMQYLIISGRIHHMCCVLLLQENIKAPHKENLLETTIPLAEAQGQINLVSDTAFKCYYLLLLSNHAPSSSKAKKTKNKRKNRALQRIADGVKRPKLTPVTKPKKPCHFYDHGKCRQGNNCKFSHDFTPSTKSKPCTHFACGSCLKGEECPYDHELSKYECHNYKNNGTCARGDNCKFSHV
ncbi:hypothetical protein ACJX0J_018654, partial [Zea mays]